VIRPRGNLADNTLPIVSVRPLGRGRPLSYVAAVIHRNVGVISGHGIGCSVCKEDHYWYSIVPYVRVFFCPAELATVVLVSPHTCSMINWLHNQLNTCLLYCCSDVIALQDWTNSHNSE